MVDSLLNIAIRASVEAGVKILKIYNSDFNVEYKDDNSPLTAADKKANAIINSYLKPTNIPIISEENEEISYEVRRQWDKCWIVDPLDGTKEFVKRNGEFTVNIALIDNGKPILGVIYVPVSQVLYFADNNKSKAYKLMLTDHIVSEGLIEDAKELAPGISENKTHVVGSRSHMNDDTLQFIENLKQKGHNVNVVAAGSSLKFCLVAEGKAQLYPRFAPTMEWDTAAGHAICNAVDVKVMQVNSTSELKYNKENLYNPNFIVTLKQQHFE